MLYFFVARVANSIRISASSVKLVYSPCDLFSATVFSNPTQLKLHQGQESTKMRLPSWTDYRPVKFCKTLKEYLVLMDVVELTFFLNEEKANACEQKILP